MLSDIAKFHLSLSYGDKDRCISELQAVILKYNGCKNHNSERVVKRINYYTNILKHFNEEYI